MVMTMIMKKANPSHRTRSRNDDVLLALNNETKTILYYKKLEENRVIRFPLVS